MCITTSYVEARLARRAAAQMEYEDAGDTTGFGGGKGLYNRWETHAILITLFVKLTLQKRIEKKCRIGICSYFNTSLTVNIQ